MRRRAQLRRVRPDVEFREFRGNIPTRLERIPDGGAIVMALAALEVLGLTDRVAQLLDPVVFVPAVGQGCVAVECRTGDKDTLNALRMIDHPPTRRAVTIERAFLAELGAGCTMPAGAYAAGDTLHVFLAGEADGRLFSEAVALSGELEDDLRSSRTAARHAHESVAPG